MTYRVPVTVIDAALQGEGEGERVLLLLGLEETVSAPPGWQPRSFTLDSPDGTRIITLHRGSVQLSSYMLDHFDRVFWSPSWWGRAPRQAREAVWAFHNREKPLSSIRHGAADQNAEKLTKTPFRYVPLWFVAELAWVMWHGAQKAGRSLDCWKELEKDQVLADYPEAAMRHLQAIQEQGLGARDAESGRLHAVHVAGCAIIMAWHGAFR